MKITCNELLSERWVGILNEGWNNVYGHEWSGHMSLVNEEMENADEVVDHAD